MTVSTAPSQSKALDVIAGLLPELDDEFESTGTPFFNRLCEALCRLASLERAGLVLYDEARRLVVPVGSHGVDPAVLLQIYGTLEETPMAQIALAKDRVVEVSEDLEEHVPARYADFAGITTLTCTPVSAAGRWLGVIFADRGGGRFSLTEHERQTMLAFGKAAALAASTRLGVSQTIRARELSARLDLARELHERVVQRLFGVSLALGSEHELNQEERERCAVEIQEALADMRATVARPLAPPSFDTGSTLREELERLRRHYDHLSLVVDWQAGVEVPKEMEPLAQAVLAEALRNCDKHSDAKQLTVQVGQAGGMFFVEVRNDGSAGTAQGPRGAGIGLRLAALEAIQNGGMVEFGPVGDGEWRVRLVLPLGGEER
ncbi:MAG: GAF domain-containing sensor histidine kinase [Solirubrobacterales bacterium]